MTARTRLSPTAIALAVVGLATSFAQAGSAWPSWTQAVKTTQQTGMPTVLVVTSRNVPSSGDFAQSLANEVAARPGIGAQFAEFSVEANPEVSKRLGITNVPALLLYRRGGSGLELVAKTTVSDPSTALGWVGTFTGMTADAAPTRDPSVLKTMGHHHQQQQVQPSAQGNYTNSPPQVQQTPQTQMTAPTQQMVMTPVTGPPPSPVVLQSPGQSVVLNQSPLQVMVGPAPAPVVTFVQGPSSLPQVNVATIPQQQQVQTNLFTQSPGGPNVNTPPSVASPQQQYVQSQMPQQQMVQFPAAQQQFVQAGGQLVQGQQNVAAGGAPVGLLLHQPGILGRALGSLGRALTPLGNPRVSMSPVTPMTVAVPQTMMVQGQQGQQQQFVNSPGPQQQYQQNVPNGPSPQGYYQQPVSASPQSDDDGHHLFRIFRHRKN